MGEFFLLLSSGIAVIGHMLMLNFVPALKKSAKEEEYTAHFKSTYADWIDPSNNFISYNDEYDQARVIFIGSEAFSQDDDGQIPTVSEGMGYGLLLSYANDDQILFDKFLRYIIATSNQYGCSLFDGNNTKTCLETAPFMMPWIVNEKGLPFWYMSDPSSSEAYYSSGSASDADFQIAWALDLAAKRVKEGSWNQSTFSTTEGEMDYEKIFLVMAKAIRLNDINFRTMIYNPGNQWGLKGVNVLYPGYFTPSAFDALNQVPKPYINNECPSEYPKVEPESSLLLVFVNNVDKGISIDYMGGNGPMEPGSHFIPKKSNQNAFQVESLTRAKTIFTTGNSLYANATFKANYYNSRGKAEMSAQYYFEYQNGSWSYQDLGSTPEAKICMEGNVAFVYLTAPNIQKVEFDYEEVKKNSVLALRKFQNNYKTGLFPNVDYLLNNFPKDNAWSNSFGFDAARFPLWASYYAYKTNPNNEENETLIEVLTALMSQKGVKPFIKDQGAGFTLPSGGINALKGLVEGDWSVAYPALNGPIALAAKLMGDERLYMELMIKLCEYDIKVNQPSNNDPEGDSTPYFNAVILLLTKALLENRI
ncbi:MAG: glycosyl hydrolase family 8 [Simkaniaceae bacterium]